MRLDDDQLRDWVRSGPRLLDGATGTEIDRRGVPTTLPLWSADALRVAPDVVEAIHRDYFAAGAEILVANTFRTNVRTMARAGRLDQAETYNRLAVRLARSAIRDAERRVLVAASIAPVEDCYHPERAPEEAVLRAEHAQQIAWLRDAEPDLLWIETMNTIREARAAACAAREARLPFVVSFVTNQAGDLLSGEPLRDALGAIEPLAPLAVGINCIPPRGVEDLLPRLASLTRLPLVAYAHIGNPEPIRGWSFSEEIAPADFADSAMRWIAAGASIVGGCCGTTPAHIAAIAARLACLGAARGRPAPQRSGRAREPDSE